MCHPKSRSDYSKHQSMRINRTSAHAVAVVAIATMIRFPDAPRIALVSAGAVFFCSQPLDLWNITRLGDKLW